jgi:hypothetical protein
MIVGYVLQLNTSAAPLEYALPVYYSGSLLYLDVIKQLDC